MSGLVLPVIVLAKRAPGARFSPRCRGRMTTVNRSIQLDVDKCLAARVRKGFSRERLAEESRGGLSVATIKRLEKGTPVYLDTARRYAALMTVALTELVDAGGATACTTEQLSASPATIAVLPFDSFGSDDTDGRFLGDGLVEDLTTRLGRQWFPVVSRGSTSLYRGDRPDARTIGRELGADYLIEGSVRRSDGRVRVTARLTDATRGLQLWANGYDRPYKDVFLLQDELVSTIVGQAGGAILEHQSRGLLARDPTDMTSWELALRGSWCFYRRTKDGNAEARSLLEQALRGDPAIARAWYLLAMTHQRAIVNQWAPDPARSVRDLSAVCGEFAKQHPNDPGLRIATAYAAVYGGKRAFATAQLREAIDLDPNAATAYSLYGQMLSSENQADEAIEQFELALRLSPRDSELWSIQTSLALCHFVAERFDEMLRWAQAAVQTRPDMPFPHGAVAVARANLGESQEAKAAVGKMLELEPRTSLKGVQLLGASTNPDIVARYLAGLRRAGFPG